MRTTIDIPEDLINEAMRVTKSRTKAELIKNALYNMIQKNKIKSLKSYKGKIGMETGSEQFRYPALFAIILFPFVVSSHMFQGI